MQRVGQSLQQELWLEHWRDEGDAAFLYRRIAAAEADPTRAKVFADLARGQDQHVTRREQALRSAGIAPQRRRPTRLAPIMPLVRGRLGWRCPRCIRRADA